MSCHRAPPPTDAILESADTVTVLILERSMANPSLPIFAALACAVWRQSKPKLDHTSVDGNDYKGRVASATDSKFTPQLSSKPHSYGDIIRTCRRDAADRREGRLRDEGISLDTMRHAREVATHSLQRPITNLWLPRLLAGVHGRAWVAHYFAESIVQARTLPYRQYLIAQWAFISLSLLT